MNTRGWTLLCYLGYLGAARWLKQPNKTRCQPTPLATSIHSGLSSFLLASFFLCTHHHVFTSPNRPPFIASPRTETLNKTNTTHPHFAAVVLSIPLEKHTSIVPMLHCCWFISIVTTDREGGQINMTMIDRVLTRLAGDSPDRWLWEKRRLDANLIKASMKN